MNLHNNNNNNDDDDSNSNSNCSSSSSNSSRSYRWMEGRMNGQIDGWMDSLDLYDAAHGL